jgi:DNA helicase II / ATP-dependent DNA helicase PcrA
VIDLARSYRSTKPIIEFTRHLVPGGDRIIPFEREGERPVLTQVSGFEELHQRIEDRVRAMRSSGFSSIAIICKSAEESANAYGALSGIEGIKHLKKSSAEYEQGIVIIPSYLAKGIEFDAVIIYDASEQVYGQESLRRLFYTACTRAMHELQLYSAGEPSPFLQEALREGLIRTESQR